MLLLILISAALLLLSSQPTTAQVAFEADYLWPLKIEKKLSSGFGDIRTGRFHMGVDLRTGGKEGEKVYAPEDGYVWRLKTSYAGYGKALYIRGLSGRTYVFGHLQTYDWDIGTYLQKKQIESRRYYQDIYLKENELPVKRGQFVARTGQTGAGAPHLHFEVRDSHDRPTNPLYYNVDLDDETAPAFEALWLVWLDDSTLVDGGRREVELKPVYDKKTGQYSVADTVLVSGRFAVMAAVSDFVGKGSFTLGPSFLRLLIGGRVYHEINYDRIDFAENIFSLLDRDFHPDKKQYKRVYNLYRKPGNRLTNYKSQVVGNGSFSDTAAGYHDVLIEASDPAGNTSRLEFTFFYVPSIEILEPFNRAVFGDTLAAFLLAGNQRQRLFDSVALRPVGIDPGTDTLQVGLQPIILIEDNFLTLKGGFSSTTDYELRFSQQGQLYPTYYFSTGDVMPQGENAIMRLETDISDRGILFTATAPKAVNWLQAEIITDTGSDRGFYRKTGIDRFSLFYRPGGNVSTIESVITRGPIGYLPDTARITIHHARKGERSEMNLRPGCRLLTHQGCLFADVLITAVDTVMPAPKTGYFIHGPFVLGPGTVSFSDWADLQFDVPDHVDNIEKIGLYVFSEQKGWLWAGGRYDPAARILHTPLGGAGVLAVIADTGAPVISALNISENERIKSDRPTVRFILKDELSGIENDLNFNVSIDDRWIVPEYDPDEGTFKSKPHWSLTGGRHILKINVRDRCGNAISIQRNFMVGAKTGP